MKGQEGLSGVKGEKVCSFDCNKFLYVSGN